MIPAPEKKKKCPDCIECQMCSKSRCQQCRKGRHQCRSATLGPFVTRGEYLEWKKIATTLVDRVKTEG